MITMTVLPHPAFGPLLQIDGLTRPALRLTLVEAQILSRALQAVAQGRAPHGTDEIFMSPMASDATFTGIVQDIGVQCPEQLLSWSEVEALAHQLQQAAVPHVPQEARDETPQA